MKRNFHALSTHRRRGFTLVEAAIVMGIVCVIMAAVWVGYGAVSRQNKNNRTAQFVQTSVMKLGEFMKTTGGKGLGFPPDPGCGGGENKAPLTTNAVNAGIFNEDQDLLTGDPLYPLATPWGNGLTSNIQLEGDSYNECSGGLKHTFNIDITGIPSDACQQLLTANLLNFIGLGLYSITINTKTQYYGITQANYTTLAPNYPMGPSPGVTSDNISLFCAEVNPTSMNVEFLYPPPAP